MSNLMRFVFSFFLILGVSGCGVNLFHGLGFETDTPKFWETYNKIRAENDALAAAGKTTWVQASKRIRDADKYLAENKSGYDTSWKFDSDDEEYHSYVIAMAERLDLKQISFSVFDAARIAKRNEIDTRRQSINIQQRSLQSPPTTYQRSGFMCARVREISAGMGTHCVYSCATGEVIQTVGPTQICPISITR